ncbi:bifunctional methionine sulfoxide reductase B/A protein [Candidatus Riflebacteria bacterium]
MKFYRLILLIVAGFSIFFFRTRIKAVEKWDKDMQYNQLSSEEERVIIHKSTERPFSGKYFDHWEKGTYTCKRCDAPLFNSKDKFDFACGWPSFDDEITGAIKRVPDPDGERTEILCNNCDAHLGHVFLDEEITKKNVRHCVNSISINFSPENEKEKPKKAYFAGGCFWGVEYYFQNLKGVLGTQVGYMGGRLENPSYREVCSGTTGHIEAMEVVYNPAKTSYEKLAKLFFEIHDPTQVNRQGPDIGEQYKSAIFYVDNEQKVIAEKLIKILEEKGLKIATRLIQAKTFWNAENYHQDYYKKNGKAPYCHTYIKRF